MDEKRIAELRDELRSLRDEIDKELMRVSAQAKIGASLVKTFEESVGAYVWRGSAFASDIPVIVEEYKEAKAKLLNYIKRLEDLHGLKEKGVSNDPDEGKNRGTGKPVKWTRLADPSA